MSGFININNMVSYLELYEIEKERYAKEMATQYSEYVKEMLAMKWEILSYDDWKVQKIDEKTENIPVESSE